MDVADLTEYARQQYNSVSDDFFSSSEFYRHIWAAQNELALKANCIRQVYTTTTVASQQEYTRPTNAISIKRITYNGGKLFPINFREDDAMTLSNQATTATGTPQYYFEWGSTISLRPIPNAAQTLKIYCFNQPQEVTVTSTLEVHERYHLQIADYICMKAAAKEKDFESANYYKTLWDAHVLEAIKYERKMLRGDAFAHVIDEEQLPISVIGAL